MKQIIVAGAGIGGLAVGALLAKDGFFVTLYTDRDPVETAYDWEDSFNIKAAATLVGVSLDASQTGYLCDNRYYSPSQKTPIETSFGKNRPTKAERKLLARLLTDYAEKCGVQFVQNTKITEAVTEGNRVTGIRTAQGQVLPADLVIDACGVDSPVRRSLPDGCKIEQNYAYGEVFYAYRGIFEKKGDTPPDPHAYEIYLMHRGEPGISWFITEENCTDILLGRFRPFGQEKVDAEYENFAKEHPQLGEKLLRGGIFAKIPVRRPLAKMVCDGYAAIGDSAYMTYPMSGSGIDLALRAAVLLHNCIASDKKAAFTTKTLWPYQREYILRHAASLHGVSVLKNELLNFTPEKLDMLFDKRIITQNDLTSGGAAVSVSDMVGRVIRGAFHLPTLIRTAKAALCGGTIERLYREIPVVYTDAAFDAWKKKIDQKKLPLKR